MTAKWKRELVDDGREEQSRRGSCPHCLGTAREPDHVLDNGIRAWSTWRLPDGRWIQQGDIITTQDYERLEFQQANKARATVPVTLVGRPVRGGNPIGISTDDVAAIDPRNN